MNRPIALALPLSLAAACHTDFTSANGALGRLEYRLATDYDAGADTLTDLLLLTRHPVAIDVSPTPLGEEEAGEDLDELEHGSDDAEVESHGEGGFHVTADAAGEVRIESRLDGEVFDWIVLEFAHPTGLDLVTWVRAPWADDWTRAPADAPLSVAAGTEVSFLAIPVADGVRLGGQFVPEVAVDRPELAVPDQTVYATQEGGVTSGSEPLTFYVVGAGSVTFTLSDPAHDVAVQRVVQITE